VDHVARTPAQLGQILRSCRKLRALTQQQVADRVGVKQATVSSIEQDSSGTSVASLYKLLSALDLELVVRDRTGKGSSRASEREW
jgi:HTH-type transcriptional regulator / antitoxin HipB